MSSTTIKTAFIYTISLISCYNHVKWLLVLPLYNMRKPTERICDLFIIAQPAGGSLDMNSGLYPS